MFHLVRLLGYTGNTVRHGTEVWKYSSEKQVSSSVQSTRGAALGGRRSESLRECDVEARYIDVQELARSNRPLDTWLALSCNHGGRIEACTLSICFGGQVLTSPLRCKA